MTDSQMPQPGDPAPDFSLPAWPEGTVSLSEFAGQKNVVLFFYPKDDTPGCTKEACGFRDEIAKFDAADTAVFGISCDSVESHGKFSGKFDLNFPLLCDDDHSTCEKYGVWVEKNRFGKKSMGIQRATFLIGKDGNVAKVWPAVNVDGHVDEVADAVAAL